MYFAGSDKSNCFLWIWLEVFKLISTSHIGDGVNCIVGISLFFFIPAMSEQALSESGEEKKEDGEAEAKQEEVHFSTTVGGICI